MSEVRLVLSSEDYVTLYSQLADRRLKALDIVSLDGVIYVEDAQGNTSYSDWAQDEFDDECGIIENFLAETGIVQEDV